MGRQGLAGGGGGDDDDDPVTPLKVAGDALLHRFFNLSNHRESLPTILRANAELAELRAHAARPWMTALAPAGQP